MDKFLLDICAYVEVSTNNTHDALVDALCTHVDKERCEDLLSTLRYMAQINDRRFRSWLNSKTTPEDFRETINTAALLAEHAKKYGV